MTQAPDAACQQFPEIGSVVSVVPVSGGHIHESWRVTASGGEFLVQRCNMTVFGDLQGVMGNVTLVCERVYPELCPLATRDGSSLWWAGADEAWRVFPYLAGTVNARDVSDPFAPERLRELGHGLAVLHGALTRVDPASLVDSIPHFHDPRRRLAQFDAARAADPHARVATAGPEIDAVDALRAVADLVDQMTPPRVPRRVAHFDAKIDNFLLDGSGRVRAVVDLDTVMPGSILWDVGDLVRSAAATSVEDEPRPERMAFVPDRYRNIVTGYLSAASGFLTAGERDALAVAPLVITFEQAVRFLTDFLDGDVYYRTARPRHNLERARAQLALVESMRTQQSDMILAP